MTPTQAKCELASTLRIADWCVLQCVSVRLIPAFQTEGADVPTQNARRLVRKQILVTEDQIDKLDRIAGERGVPVTEVVRQAIDAYDPEGISRMDAPELMDLVGRRLKEALRETRRANRRVNSVLAALDDLEGAA
jgi:hypothetical protein